MTLDQALAILAEVHTADSATGFQVTLLWPYASPTPAYVEAWKIVRVHLHLQTEPPG